MEDLFTCGECSRIARVSTPLRYARNDDDTVAAKY